MEPRHFRYQEAEGVATLHLDRPERLNALTFDSDDRRSKRMTA